MKIRNPGNALGFSMFEMAIVLAVLGAVFMLLANLLPSFKQVAASNSSTQLTQSVQLSLSGFAYARGRLPWADSDGDGAEDADSASGKLPWKTLGQSAPVLNAQGLEYAYAVYARADAEPMDDTELTVLKDRFRPTIARNLPPVADPRALGHDNSLDFCRALYTGGNVGSVDTQYAHMVNGSVKEHVAYLLVDPGLGDADNDGELFDGNNLPGDMGFDSPSRTSSRSYDDKVIAVRFSQLWESLNCSGVMSATGHAHPNVETSLALLRQSLRDYQTQVSILYDLSFADNFAAGASVASAAAGLANAASLIPIGTASAINTAGATSGSVAAAVAAIAANTIATGVAATLTGIAGARFADMEDRKDEIQALIDRLDKDPDGLYQAVQDNVQNSDDKALYLQ